MNTNLAITDGISNFFTSLAAQLGDVGIIVLALVLSIVIVAYYFVKVYFTYEGRLNRSLAILINWLYNNKQMTEDNVKNFNTLIKAKAPKQLVYYWQQYILFREGTPSSYMNEKNIIEKPLKASAFDANLRNMIMWTCVWALFSGALMVIYSASVNQQLILKGIFMGLMVATAVLIIGGIGALIFRARKNATLNRLYRNLSLFNRFMDNACQFLPIYVDYQILFTA